MITIKRVYELTPNDDAYRILVDKFWPRGLAKDKVKIDLWLKGLAPSDKLRRWFDHSPAKWQGFKKMYKLEIVNDYEKLQLLRQIRQIERDKGRVLLVYSAKNQENNNALALSEMLGELT